MQRNNERTNPTHYIVNSHSFFMCYLIHDALLLLDSRTGAHQSLMSCNEAHFKRK